MATNTTRRPVDLGDIEYLYAVQHISSEASAKKLYKIQLTDDAKALLLEHKELTAYLYLENLAYRICQITCSSDTRVNIVEYYAQQFLVNSLRNSKDGYELSEEELYSKENYDIAISRTDEAFSVAVDRLYEEQKPKVMVYKEDVGIPWNNKYNYAHFDSPILGSAIYPDLDIYTNKYYVNMDKLFGLEYSKNTSLDNTTNPKVSDEELLECFKCSSPKFTKTTQSDKYTELRSELASFDKILAVCAEEYQAKAVKYGNSLDDMQLSTLADLLLAKSNRVYSFLADSKELLVNESVTNDLRAIINYAIVSVIKATITDPYYSRTESEYNLTSYQVMAQEAKAILQSKNADYDQAWKQFAISSLADLIKVKIIRVKNMLANNDYSSLADNYYDIINYAVFTLIRLEDK